MHEEWAIRQITAPTKQPVHLTALKNHAKVDVAEDDALLAGKLEAAVSDVENFWGRRFVAQTIELVLDDFPDCDEIELPFPPLVSVTHIKYIDTDGATQTLATTEYVVDAASAPGRVMLAYLKSWPVTRGRPQAVTIRFVCGYLAPFTAVAATDVITVSGRTFADGDVVRVSNSGGALPAGLVAETDYYVRDVVGSTFKLAATSGGTAIDITDAGSGTSFIGVAPGPALVAALIRATDLYENREDVVVGTISGSLGAIDQLLWPDRVLYEGP